MELESGSQTVYRLVVALDDRDVVFDAPLFTRFKQARGRVAAAVCREARAGIVRKVTLERGTPRSRASTHGRHVLPTTRGRSPSAMQWTTMAHWEADVVQRILRQNGIAPPTVTPEPRLLGADAAAHWTSQSLPCSAASTLAPPPRSNTAALRLPRRIRRKQTRWQLIGVAVLLAATWLGLAYLQTGGHPFQQLAALRGGAPAVVTELPFYAPSQAADDTHHDQPPARRRVQTRGDHLEPDASKSPR